VSADSRDVDAQGDFARKTEDVILKPHVAAVRRERVAQYIFELSLL
jgi:hypothetical protein